jgi:hypothetical protein
MDDDNLFDKDKALDLIMSEEVDNKPQRISGKSGCLGLVVLLILPVVAMCRFVIF